MMRHLQQIIFLTVLLFGLSGAYIAKQTLMEDATRNWRAQADRDGQWLTSTLLAWLEESFAPMSGLAVLIENSAEVDEDKFLNAFDGLEARAAAFFLDSAALATAEDEETPSQWTVMMTTDPGGLLSDGVRVDESEDLGNLVSMAYGRSGEIILGQPLSQDGGEDVFLPVGTHVFGATGHAQVLGLVDVTALVQGLFELSVPPGMGLSVRGRFPEPAGQGAWRDVFATAPNSDSYSVTTRTVSAGAELAITWHFDQSFLGGPSRKLADAAFYGGASVVLILTLFLGYLMTQNQRISRIVDERTGELDENRRVLSNVLENIPQGLVAYDEHGRITAWNTKYQTIFELDGSLMFSGQTVAALVTDFARRGGYGDGDPEAEAEKRIKILLSGESFRSDFTFPSGRTYDAFSTPTPHGGGVISYTDITDLIESQRSAKLLREAIDSYSEMFALYDRNGRVIFTNDRYHEIYPHSPPKDEIQNYTMEDLLRRSVNAGMIAEPLAKSDPEAWIRRALAERWSDDEQVGETTHANGRTFLFRHKRTTEGGLIVVQVDITERKRIENALAEREKNFRRILENSPIAVAISNDDSSDEDGLVTFMNRQFTKLLELGGEDLEGYRTQSFSPNRGEARERIQETLNRGDSVSDLELQITTHQGNRVWVLMSISPMHYQNRKSALIWLYDISELKQQEESIRRNQERLSEILNVSSAACTIIGLDGRIEFANQRALEMVGLPESEFVGSMARDYYANPEEMKTVNATMARDGAVHETEIQLKRPDGTPVEVLLSVARTDFAEGPRIINWGYDITQLKDLSRELSQARQEIQRQFEIVQLVIDNIDQGVVLRDAELNFRLFNAKFLDLFGLPKDRFRAGSNYREAIAYFVERGDYDDAEAEAVIEKRVQQTLELEQSREARTRELSRNALGLVLEERANPIDSGGYVITYTDITARKQLEDTLVEARNAAQAASEAKANFLATMSHEIRTPMNGVVTMADILDQTRLDAEQHEMTRTIRQSAEALLTVINDILDFSKIEAGKLAIETLRFDILDQIEGVLDLLAPRAEAKSLMLLMDIVEPLPARLLGDPNRLRQILLNLGGNAVKFTETGQVTVRVCRVPSDGGAYLLRVEIEDTGIGMTPEQQGSLFQAFSQAEMSTARRFGGTGLGLAISKRLVELMGGEIGVESTPDLGSTFWFTLPFDVESDAFIEPAHDITDATVVLAGYDPKEAESFKSALKLGGVPRIHIAPTPEELERLVAKGVKADLGLLNGRPGIPTVSDWGRKVPAVLRDGHANILITAPHMAASALAVDAAVFPKATLLGTMPVPIHSRRLWDYVAVGTGKIRREDLQAVSDEAVTYVAPSIEEARARGAAVLVAEDNETNRLVIGRVLDRLGIAHDMAEDGEIALRMLGEAEYGLLLTDFHMPIMDGFELTRRWREVEAKAGTTPHLPVVALTADVLPETARLCEEVGMDGYLRKPIELERLEDVFKRFVPDVYDLRAVRVAPTEVADDDVETTETEAGARAISARRKIAGVDPDIFEPDALIDAFGDFDDDAADFVLGFADSLKGSVTALHAAFEAGDFKLARHHAHAMKGSSLSSGAIRIGRLMEDIQDALDEDDPDTADIYREGVDETLQELLDALAPLQGA